MQRALHGVGILRLPDTILGCTLCNQPKVICPLTLFRSLSPRHIKPYQLQSLVDTAATVPARVVSAGAMSERDGNV